MVEGCKDALAGVDALTGDVLVGTEGPGRGALDVLLGANMLARCTAPLTIDAIGVGADTDGALLRANALVEESHSLVPVGAGPLGGMAEVRFNPVA